jgi:osmoprotectant transport system substrate-binding protein
VPVVRQDVLDAHPDLKPLLDTLATRLDDATMQRLNGEVDVQKKTIEAVATGYLKEASLF